MTQDTIIITFAIAIFILGAISLYYIHKCDVLQKQVDWDEAWKKIADSKIKDLEAELKRKCKK